MVNSAISHVDGLPPPDPSRSIASRLRLLATYDTFPRFSAKFRCLLYNPLGVLSIAALAALLCGVFLHPQGYLLCGGIAMVVALGVAWPWLTLRGVEGSLSFDRVRAREGEGVEVRLTLSNWLPWPACGLALHGGFGAEAGTEIQKSEVRSQRSEAPLTSDLCPLTSVPMPVASIACAPRRRSVLCRWSFAPRCRGVYPLTVPRLTTGFPFGLWHNKRNLNVASPLIVWPRTLPVGPVPPVSGDQQVEGNVSRNKVGSNGDMLGVRPYRRGDTPRRIHWSQSARHDRLIVCELQANARPVIQLVLDVDARVHAGTGPDSSREWAIRVVASFAMGWLQAGAQVGAVWSAQAIPAAAGVPQLRCLLDGLAQLSETAGQTLPELLSRPACRGFHEGLQVIVTTDIGARRCSLRADDRQRWVVLRTPGFEEPERPSCATPQEPGIRPWLLIESAQQIPELLRGGWTEARHGT
jgi:uncharacterized protein (DUF58 family)